MKHSAVYYLLIIASIGLFIAGRVIYLWKIEKHFDGNNTKLLEIVRNDLILRIIFSVGIGEIILLVIKDYFRNPAAEGLYIGLLTFGAIIAVLLKMKRDENVRSRILKDFKKTNIAVLLWLGFLLLGAIYTFFNSVKVLFFN